MNIGTITGYTDVIIPNIPLGSGNYSIQTAVTPLDTFMENPNHEKGTVIFESFKRLFVALYELGKQGIIVLDTKEANLGIIKKENQALIVRIDTADTITSTWSLSQITPAYLIQSDPCLGEDKNISALAITIRSLFLAIIGKLYNKSFSKVAPLIGLDTNHYNGIILNDKFLDSEVLEHFKTMLRNFATRIGLIAEVHQQFVSFMLGESNTFALEAITPLNSTLSRSLSSTSLDKYHDNDEEPIDLSDISFTRFKNRRNHEYELSYFLAMPNFNKRIKKELFREALAAYAFFNVERFNILPEKISFAAIIDAMDAYQNLSPTDYKPASVCNRNFHRDNLENEMAVLLLDNDAPVRKSFYAPLFKNYKFFNPKNFEALPERVRFSVILNCMDAPLALVIPDRMGPLN